MLYAVKARLSIGTAVALGLKRLKVDALPTTAYVMDGGGRCSFNCAFCSQARNATSGDDRLSRVVWPEFELDEITEGLKKAVASGQIRRACIQVTLNSGSWDRTMTLLSSITSAVKVPVSVSTTIQNEQQVDQLMAAGAARVSIALDAATEELHNMVKNTGYDFKIKLLTRCTAKYPGRISTHFIVGLGETEQEVLEAIQAMYDQNVTVGLFAFTPLKGTPMELAPPPSEGRYRRVQLANWLMKHRHIRFDSLSFHRGRLIDLGMDQGKALKLAEKGEPFQTAGCKDCNRPYYNENPGHGVMYNYPRPLSEEEARICLVETELFDVLSLGATS